MSEYKNNREHAIAIINAGGATQESLIEALGTNKKSLASLFAQLRLMGSYPMKNEDETYFLGTQEDFEAARAERSARASQRKTSVPKTYEERLEAAQRREDRASAAATRAHKAYEDDSSKVNELRVTIADAELELASILLGQVSANEEDTDTAENIQL